MGSGDPLRSWSGFGGEQPTLHPFLLSPRRPPSRTGGLSRPLSSLHGELHGGTDAGPERGGVQGVGRGLSGPSSPARHAPRRSGEPGSAPEQSGGRDPAGPSTPARDPGREPSGGAAGGALLHGASRRCPPSGTGGGVGMGARRSRRGAKGSSPLARRPSAGQRSRHARELSSFPRTLARGGRAGLGPGLCDPAQTASPRRLRRLSGPDPRRDPSRGTEGRDRRLRRGNGLRGPRHGAGRSLPLRDGGGERALRDRPPSRGSS